MSYFRKIPVILKYKLQDKQYDIVDITRRSSIVPSAKNDPFTFYEHTIKDGETPVILADRMYDNPDLYWVILYFNNLYDIESEWPLTVSAFKHYVNRKYNDPQEIHHYESVTHGIIVNEDWPAGDRVSITNFEYESDINEQKRIIKLPLPQLVGDIVEQHNNLVRV